MEGVQIAALCDLDLHKAQTLAERYAIPRVYTDYAVMLRSERPDVLDIITPPSSHLEICQAAARSQCQIICQKPLAPTLAEARRLVQIVNQHGVRCMVHENFRFQPWYRKMRELIDQEAIGGRLHSVYMRSRMGDGWQTDAYLDRQPYFRTMPRLLVYETGIHFVDTFRFLMGEVTRVFSSLRTLNASIVGEDCGILFFEFENGATGIWDANRYNESNAPNFRYTFGELLLEGSGGSIRLYADGRITLQPLGGDEVDVPYQHDPRYFGSDCVFHTQRHFLQRYLSGEPFENSAEKYLRNIEIQEALYESAKRGSAVSV